MKFDQKTILTILAVLVVAGGAYWYFFTGQSGNAAPLTATTLGDPAQTRFQTMIAELQPISFDTSVFTDARFMALVDISTAITPESTGRLDPFAPVSGTMVTTKK